MKNQRIVEEWFSHGNKDIKDARFLFDHKRNLETVSFHIQQAAEKYLKGFLISQGKELQRIHDLVKLLQDAIEIDSSFQQFKESVKKVTNFYFESRYPIGYEFEYTRSEVKEALIQVTKLIKLIKDKVK
ncbi:MAG TPA: HEPN domain-containing protein [Candidatus Brocadiia bacterium]|nr:HEPN domain-containing protein [Planctomycetota bacterium]MDO8093938.1 HEPN domain-containing protein [Candidatus Brocadiales bacterium]